MPFFRDVIPGNDGSSIPSSLRFTLALSITSGKGSSATVWADQHLHTRSLLEPKPLPPRNECRCWSAPAHLLPPAHLLCGHGRPSALSTPSFWSFACLPGTTPRPATRILGTFRATQNPARNCFVLTLPGNFRPPCPERSARPAPTCNWAEEHRELHTLVGFGLRLRISCDGSSLALVYLSAYSVWHAMWGFREFLRIRYVCSLEVHQWGEADSWRRWHCLLSVVRSACESLWKVQLACGFHLKVELYWSFQGPQMLIAMECNPHSQCEVTCSGGICNFQLSFMGIQCLGFKN
jgi:hypothetical protein